MKCVTRGRRAATRFCSLTLAAVLLALVAAAPAAQAQTAKAQVIALPLVNNTKVEGDDLALRVGVALRMGLVSTNRASIVSLRASSPAVRRAIDLDHTLDAGDLDIKPPVERGQAARLGRALGADMVIWGSIDEYAFVERTKSVTLGLSVSKLIPATGQVSVIAVSGKTSKPTPGLARDEGAARTEAIDDAVGQIVQTLVGAAPSASGAPATPRTSVRKKNRTWQILTTIAAVAAVATLSQHGGGSDSTVANIVQNPRVTARDDSVLVTWSTSSTSTSITGFNLYRREIGSVPQTARSVRAPGRRIVRSRQASGSYSLLTSVGRTGTSYNDGTAIVGRLYEYQIAAATSSSESQHVDCVNTREATFEVGPAYPVAPAKPAVTATFLNSLSLQWTKNSESFVESYRVYRATSLTGGAVVPATATLVGEVDASVNTITDVGPLTNGATYYYAIGAVTAATSANGRIGQPLTLEFAAALPAPPTNVAVAARVDAVNVSWTASADTSVTGYRIYRGGTLVHTVTGRTTTSWLDSPLAAGSYSYAVSSIAGSPVVESAQVAAVPATISPTSPPSYLVIAEPITVVANGTATVDVVATATDASSNAVPGVDVTFSLTNGGDGALVAPLTAVTDTNGQATVEFRAGTDPAIQPQVTASCTGVGNATLSDSAIITLQARAVTTVTLVAAASTVIADGLSSTTLTATVADQAGGGLPGITVDFASEAPSLGVVSPASAVTDAQGQATATLTSAASGQLGNCAVTATAGAVEPGRVIVTFVAAPQVTVSLQPATLPAAGTAASTLVTAAVKYTDGDPVADGTVVRFSFEGGATLSNTGAQISSGRERATTVSGIAYSTVFSATDLTHGDSDVVWAWMDLNDDGIHQASEPLGSAVVSYTEAPASVSLTGNPLSIPSGAKSVSKLVADVRTASPNPSGDGNLPVADGTVVRFLTSAGTFVDSAATTTTARTTGGLATVFLLSAQTAGTANVTASAASISGSVSVQFVESANTLITVMASPASLQADGAATSVITVRVTDASGTVKSGVAVDMRTDLGGLAANALVTDDTGVATTTFTAGLVAGTATVTATALATNGFATLALTSGEPQHVSLTLQAPYSMPATNGLASPSGASPIGTVSARVTDQFGNAVVDGTPVFFHTDIGQITGMVPTADGFAQATLITGSFLDATNNAQYRPGVASVTAYANNLAGAATAGPEYQIFCGDADWMNWDGSANDTNLYTEYGANWRLGTVGGAVSDQPNLVPTWGAFPVWFTLADRNNNPLPAGIPVSYIAYLNGKSFQTGTAATGITIGPTGPVCSASWLLDVPAWADTSWARVTVDASTPTIISTSFSLEIVQLVGAKDPLTMTIVTLGTSAPNHSSAVVETVAYDPSGTVPVQNGLPVSFVATDANNVTVEFSENPAYTQNSVGETNTVVTFHLIDPTQPGSVTILATCGTAKATVGYTVTVN